MSIHIRLARPEELETILQVERDAGERFRDYGLIPPEEQEDGEPDTFGEEHRAGIEAGKLWVAVTEAERIVGFALAYEIDREGHLREIDVLPEYGRQGIGRRLIDRVADWCRERGYPTLSLTTFRDVPWNAPYYQKAGFSVVPEVALAGRLKEILDEEREDALMERVAMRMNLS